MQGAFVAEADGSTPVQERLFVCTCLGNGMDLVAVASQSWEVLGARLYAHATNCRTPITATGINARPDGHGAQELRVQIPTTPGEGRLELLRVQDDGLRPLLSTTWRHTRNGVAEVTTVEPSRIPDTHLLLTRIDGRTPTATIRVARWNARTTAYNESPVCPDIRGFQDVIRWSSDGHHRALLGTAPLHLTPEELRNGWAPRYETSWLGWTTAPAGCPAAIVRTRTLAASARAEEERGVRFQIVDIHPRTGRLRVTERDVAGSDPRIVEAVGIGGVCGRAADCCTTVTDPDFSETQFLFRSDCNLSRQSTPGSETYCRSTIGAYATYFRSHGRPVPSVCELPPPTPPAAPPSAPGGPTAPPVQTAPMTDAAVPPAVRALAQGCTLDVAHGLSLTQPGTPIDGTSVVPMVCESGAHTGTTFVQFRGPDIVHVIGDHASNAWESPSVDGISFADVDGDGIADLIALVRAVTGMGENGGAEFTVGDFWLGTSSGEWRRDEPARSLVASATTMAAAIERLRAHYAPQGATPGGDPHATPGAVNQGAIPPAMMEEIRLQLAAQAARTPVDATNARFVGTWEGGNTASGSSFTLTLQPRGPALAGALRIDGGVTLECAASEVTPASATNGPVMRFACSEPEVAEADPAERMHAEMKCAFTLTSAGRLVARDSGTPRCGELTSATLTRRP
ncbi:MAG: hypothetical protein WCK01_00380 [Candidatus Uhrbacteria bacterium]